MASRWIEEIKEVFIYGRHIDDVVEICERIDDLLERAVLAIDNEALYDDIQKEIEEV